MPDTASVENQDALILAAGTGRRMKKIVNTRPEQSLDRRPTVPTHQMETHRRDNSIVLLHGSTIAGSYQVGSIGMDGLNQAPGQFDAVCLFSRTLSIVSPSAIFQSSSSRKGEDGIQISLRPIGSTR